VLHEEQTDKELFFIVEVDSSSARCPSCQMMSSRAHSRYTRHVDDLPISDRHVHFQILLHKWFCDEPNCTVIVFTERLSWLQTYKRKTNRLEEVIEKIAFSTNCLTAEKVCKALHIPVSHDTLLRRVQAVTFPQKASPFRGY
ncbi:transposase family protein, partial [Sporosarcina limicola]